MSNRKFAITGHPLGHTMSPPIHQRLFELSGNPAEYSIFDIPEDRLDADIYTLKALTGFNVTIPHKIAVIPYLDELDDSAKRYGSVNVVSCRQKNIGYNTDAFGFVRALESHDVPIDGKVCVLGAGGVGRMFIIECLSRGAQVTAAVRKTGLDAANRLKSEIFARDPHALFEIKLLSELNGGFDLMINATPCGMYPHTKDMPVTAKALKEVSALFDCIYNPTETLLMKTARENGCKVVGGMDMLIWQAVVAHEIWDNAEYDPADIHALISQMKQEVDRVFPGK